MYIFPIHYKFTAYLRKTYSSIFFLHFKMLHNWRHTLLHLLCNLLLFQSIVVFEMPPCFMRMEFTHVNCDSFLSYLNTPPFISSNGFIQLSFTTGSAALSFLAHGCFCVMWEFLRYPSHGGRADGKGRFKCSAQDLVSLVVAAVVGQWRLCQSDECELLSWSLLSWWPARLKILSW